MPALADIKKGFRHLWSPVAQGKPPVTRYSVVAGTTSATNIAITGIEMHDQLLSVLQVEPDNGTAATMLTDRTGEAAITSAGNIQLDTTNTTGKQLLVLWLQKN